MRRSGGRRRSFGFILTPWGGCRTLLAAAWPRSALPLPLCGHLGTRLTPRKTVSDPLGRRHRVELPLPSPSRATELAAAAAAEPPPMCLRSGRERASARESGRASAGSLSLSPLPPLLLLCHGCHRHCAVVAAAVGASPPPGRHCPIGAAAAAAVLLPSPLLLLPPPLAAAPVRRRCCCFCGPQAIAKALSTARHPPQRLAASSTPCRGCRAATRAARARGRAAASAVA